MIVDPVQRRIKQIAIAGSILLLAACGAPVPQTHAPDRSAAAKPTAPAAPTGARSPAAPPSAPGPGLKPGDLVGRTGAELVSILGTPALKWQRGNAALWQYSGSPCVYHVFLTGDGENGRVERIISRPRSGEADGNCGPMQPAGS